MHSDLISDDRISTHDFSNSIQQSFVMIFNGLKMADQPAHARTRRRCLLHRRAKSLYIRNDCEMSGKAKRRKKRRSKTETETERDRETENRETGTEWHSTKTHSAEAIPAGDLLPKSP